MIGRRVTRQCEVGRGAERVEPFLGDKVDDEVCAGPLEEVDVDVAAVVLVVPELELVPPELHAARLPASTRNPTTGAHSDRRPTRLPLP